MKDKINVAELLRDCPKGMELDSTMYENVYFDEICDDKDCLYPIRCYIIGDGVRNPFYLTKYGEFNIMEVAKCVIFPKGKTTWEGFQRPFKDGDVVSVTMHPENIWIGIFKQYKETRFESYCSLNAIGEFNDIGFKYHSLQGVHLATEEEKEKLFDAIKTNGYKWNEETKTLEKLIEPKFKVGNKIEKCGYRFTIAEVKDDYYLTKCGNKIPIDNQDDFSLVPNKFDINTLIPFESKVLVRINDPQSEWKPAIFGVYKENKLNGFYVVGGNSWSQCIPYEGNEHLLGTANDCDEFYRIWEKTGD